MGSPNVAFTYTPSFSQNHPPHPNQPKDSIKKNNIFPTHSIKCFAAHPPFIMHASCTEIWMFCAFKRIAGYFYNKLRVVVMRRRCAPFAKKKNRKKRNKREKSEWNARNDRQANGNGNMKKRRRSPNDYSSRGRYTPSGGLCNTLYAVGRPSIDSTVRVSCFFFFISFFWVMGTVLHSHFSLLLQIFFLCWTFHLGIHCGPEKGYANHANNK